MATSIPTAVASGLCAYLRQAELSIDRARSLYDLTSFFQRHSVYPDQVRAAFVAVSGGEHEEWVADWPALLKHSQSLLCATWLTIRRIISSSSALMVISDNEMASILSALKDFSALISASNLPDSSTLNGLRIKLHACSCLLLLRIHDPQLRHQIHMIDHVNSAPHLKTISIRTFQWLWDTRQA